MMERAASYRPSLLSSRSSFAPARAVACRHVCYVESIGGSNDREGRHLHHIEWLRHCRREQSDQAADQHVLSWLERPASSLFLPESTQLRSKPVGSQAAKVDTLLPTELPSDEVMRSSMTSGSGGGGGGSGSGGSSITAELNGSQIRRCCGVSRWNGLAAVRCHLLHRKELGRGVRHIEKAGRAEPRVE